MKPNEKPNPMNVNFLGRKRKMVKANPLAHLRQQARLGRRFTLVG
jgi:hypothetical protein